MPDVKLSQLPAVSPATTAEGARLWAGKGHIDGLRLEWVSGTSVRVTSGMAFIESLGYAIEVPVAITKSSLSLSASTWYHVYLYDNAGTPDVEIVTDGPAAPYSGSARSKTGDSSRRYLRSVLTGVSGGLLKDLQVGTAVSYLESAGAAPFRVLANGAATTATAVSLAGVVPETSRIASVFCQFRDPSAPVMVLGNSETAFALGANNFLGFVRPETSSSFLLPTDSARAIQYLCTGAVTGAGGFIYVNGYTFER